MVVKILADCGISGVDTTQVGKVLHYVEVGNIDANMKRTVCFLWRGLVHHLSLLQADGEAEVLGFIKRGG